MVYIVKYDFFLCVSLCRCGSLIRSGNTHRVHSCDCVWVDRADQSHSPDNDRCYISQCRSSEPPAINLRLHHTHQKAAVPPRARLGTPRVSSHSSIPSALHSSFLPSIQSSIQSSIHSSIAPSIPSSISSFLHLSLPLSIHRSSPTSFQPFIQFLFSYSALINQKCYLAVTSPGPISNSTVSLCCTYFSNLYFKIIFFNVILRWSKKEWLLMTDSFGRKGKLILRGFQCQMTNSDRLFYRITLFIY